MDVLTVIILFALLATILVLGQGIISMARGGKEDDENCETMMAMRVVVQGIAVLLILVALFLNY